MRGTVAQYLMNPSGEVDGLLLEDDTVVRFPPHLGAQLVDIAKPSDIVTVTGWSSVPRTLRAQTITNDANQRSVADAPPSPGARPPAPPADASQQSMSVSGVVRVVTHAPRGEIDGAVLRDGTIVHVPPHAGAALATLLVEGASLAATGFGVTNGYGTSLEATAIGPTPRDLQPVPAGPGPRGRR
jgi:hypothetical protein